MFLLDTNVIVNFLKLKSEAVEIINQIAEQDLYTSSICVAEVLDGLTTSKSYKQAEKFNILMQYVVIVDVTVEVAEQFALLRSNLIKTGNIIENMDLLIASSCLAYDFILVSHNLKHFQRIPHLKVFKPRWYWKFYEKWNINYAWLRYQTPLHTP